MTNFKNSITMDSQIKDSNPEGINQYTGSGGREKNMHVLGNASQKATALSKVAKFNSQAVERIGRTPKNVKGAHSYAGKMHQQAANLHREAAKQTSGSKKDSHLKQAAKHNARATWHQEQASKVTPRMNNEKLGEIQHAKVSKRTHDSITQNDEAMR